MGMTTTASTIPLQQLLEQASWAHRLARSLVHDADEADDLVQETWMATLRRPPETDRPLRPWLATVLRRQRHKHVVARQRRGRREETAQEATAAVSSPEDLLERMEVQKLLATLVTALEEPYRQTVLLRYYEGLTSAQIGERLGAPAATVRGRLKVALDRLRDALDARNGGKRERWLSLLAPLVPGAVASGTGRTALVVAAVMLTLLPVGAWIALRDHGSGASTSGASDSAPGRPGGGGSRGGGAGREMALAAVPGASAACTATVKRLREQVGAAETEAMKQMPGTKLFARGAPNPAPTKELAAILARVMATGGPAPPYTLECRTWVCKMVVVKTADEGQRPNPNPWEVPLIRDSEVRARSVVQIVLDESHVRDPVSGQRLTTQDVYLILQDPSGKAAPAGQRGPKPTLAFGPIPTDVAGCQREVEVLRVRLERAQADVEADMFVETRFKKNGPNPALTTEIAGLVRRALAAEPSPPTVECRGMVCKLMGPEPSDPWRKRLEDDPEFRLRHDGGACCTQIFYLMRTPPQVAAARWLDKLGDAFIGGPAPAACEKKHKAEGTLKMALELPAPGSPNEEGLVGQPSVKFKGPLADSPLAKCIADELARTALDAAVPEPPAAAKVYKRLKFPLVPAASPNVPWAPGN
jgi:RNA polymerase sigma-70 factor (ECF subfamily)